MAKFPRNPAWPCLVLDSTAQRGVWQVYSFGEPKILNPTTSMMHKLDWTYFNLRAEDNRYAHLAAERGIAKQDYEAVKNDINNVFIYFSIYLTSFYPDTNLTNMFVFVDDCARF